MECAYLPERIRRVVCHHFRGCLRWVSLPLIGGAHGRCAYMKQRVHVPRRKCDILRSHTTICLFVVFFAPTLLPIRLAGRSIESCNFVFVGFVWGTPARRDRGGLCAGGGAVERPLLRQPKNARVPIDPGEVFVVSRQIHVSRGALRATSCRHPFTCCMPCPNYCCF